MSLDSTAANGSLHETATPTHLSNPLTLGQKRLQLMAVLEAEQAKRIIFERYLHQNTDHDTAAIYEQLVAQQNRVTHKLERRIAELTDKLEGPELRSRLQQVERELNQTSQTLKQLQEQFQAAESARLHAETEVDLLTQQVQNLQVLNESYVNQIAMLSVHERQNAEDHAHTVLTISQVLSRHSLNIPAKASLASLDRDFSRDANTDTAFASDTRFDQTIFAVRSRQGDLTQILSLVINSVTPDVDISPIEIKLTEFRSNDNHPKTKLLKAFSTASAIAAAEAFVSLYHQFHFPEYRVG